MDNLRFVSEMAVKLYSLLNIIPEQKRIADQKFQNFLNLVPAMVID